jgi:queuine tRNA-ribosyltransferase
MRTIPILKPQAKQEAALSLGAYEVHIAREGFASMRHRASGEIMHRAPRRWKKRNGSTSSSRNSPSGLRHSTEPLVIWDVGPGAAANAMAAIG